MRINTKWFKRKESKSVDASFSVCRASIQEKEGHKTDAVMVRFYSQDPYFGGDEFRMRLGKAEALQLAAEIINSVEKIV